jgi:hypothetical protein
MGPTAQDWVERYVVIIVFVGYRSPKKNPLTFVGGG